MPEKTPRLIRGLRRAFVFPIVLYRRLISPLLPPSCIYEPTCSQYATEAVMRFGVIKGFLAGSLRVLRCAGGLFRGGEDPLPERFSLRFLLSRYRHHWHRSKTRPEA